MISHALKMLQDSNSRIDNKKAALGIIEIGINKKLCKEPNRIPWETMDRLEAFEDHLNRHLTNDLDLVVFNFDRIPDSILELPSGILDFLEIRIQDKDRHIIQ